MEMNKEFEKYKNLFIAIEIFPDDIFLDLYNKVVASVTRFGRIIWIKPEQMYLDLKTFSEVPTDKIPAIIEKMNIVISEISPFYIKIGTITAIDNLSGIKELCFGIQKNKSIELLYTQLQQEMIKLGFKKNKQRFVPHISIARLNKVASKRNFWEVINSLQNPLIQEMEVKKIMLCNSTMKPQIHVYKTIAEIFLPTKEPQYSEVKIEQLQLLF